MVDVLPDSPHPEIALRYEREAGAESCGVAEDLRKAVAARLGYDPFVEVAGVDSIVVRIRGGASGLEGTLERRDAVGQPRGQATRLVSKSADCAELSASLAVGIAIAIDPLSVTRTPALPPLPAPAPTTPAPAPQPAPLTPPAAPTAAPPSRATEGEPSAPVRVLLGAGPSVATNALPATSFGARALVGLSRGLWEVDLEGRFDAPVTMDGQGGSVQASLVLGTVAPCLRYGLVVACGEISFGALRGTGLGFDHTREENTFYVAAGVRAGLEWGLGQRFAVRVAAEGEVPLAPIRLEADGQPIWSTPAFGWALVPMLLGRFP